MSPTLIPIQKLDEATLIGMADLHYRVMPTLLAELGLPIVRRYYKIAQAHSQSTGLAALDEHGQPVGWAFGSTDPTSLTSALQNPLSWFLGQLVRASISRPIALVDLFGSMLADHSPNLLQPGQIELTYIGVASAAQGQGLGRLLLHEFVRAASQKGFTSVALSVETNNAHAIRLYSRAGFQITHTFYEGRFKRHRMEYPIPAIPA